MKLSRCIFLNIIFFTVYVFHVDCDNGFQDAMMYGHVEAVELKENSTANFGSCSSDSLEEFQNLTKSCECKPRAHLIDIGIFTPSAIVYPSLVEINRCAGSCQGYVTCVSTETKPLIVRVQKFDFFLDPYKPTCGSTELQEDVSCQCKCMVNKDDCHTNQVFNSYACKCICPNAEEERQCIREGNKWNIKQCTCLNHQ